MSWNKLDVNWLLVGGKNKKKVKGNLKEAYQNYPWVLYYHAIEIC